MSCKARISSQAEQSDRKEGCPIATTGFGLHCGHAPLPFLAGSHFKHCWHISLLLGVSQIWNLLSAPASCKNPSAWGHKENEPLLPSQCGHSLFSAFAPLTPGVGGCEFWVQEHCWGRTHRNAAAEQDRGRNTCQKPTVILLSSADRNSDDCV